MVSKNPVLNGILSCLLVAIGFSLVILVISLIKGTSFAEQYDIVMIVVCVVSSIWSGISGYLKAKKASK